jgi:UDP-2-acetamido-3-amino-2,3-dideoxy-glucuronate N-acetyltransferase
MKIAGVGRRDAGRLGEWRGSTTWRSSLLVFDQRVEFRNGEAVPIKGSGQPVLVEPAEPLRLECMAFLNAMATRRPRS